MAAIFLPALPKPRKWTPHYVSAGNDLSSPAAAATQRILRMGDRWSVTATFLNVKMDSNGRDWVAQMLLASRATALWALPLPKGGVGAPGAPVVDGAGQLGTALDVKGLTAGYAFKAMQWVSLVSGGRRYLHMVTSGVTADGTGKATLNILPMLRVSPADGATLEVAAPKIEGLLPIDPSWPINPGDIVEFTGNFTITEAR
ncbi:hypothetical protein [Asticcacaulis sp.]|uniref:hypothetical protein n=1 Tax=Asticcacaulis sp. TaxID=1872648 RepID=UPI003F7CA917